MIFAGMSLQQVVVIALESYIGIWRPAVPVGLEVLCSPPLERLSFVEFQAP